MFFLADSGLGQLLELGELGQQGRLAMLLDALLRVLRKGGGQGVGVLALEKDVIFAVPPLLGCEVHAVLAGHALK